MGWALQQGALPLTGHILQVSHMAPSDTRTQILDAAEHLFAERGFHATSVRAITDLAGANLASVAYHFGSKADLLAAVARRVIEPINASQCANLHRLLARTPDPPVTELVEAFVGPLFDEMPAGDQGGARTSRLIVRIIGDPAEEMRNWTGPAEDTVRDRYLAAFRHALPGLSPEELWFRIRGILAVAAVDRVEPYNRHPPASPSPVAGEVTRHWAITFPGGSDERATDRDLTAPCSLMIFIHRVLAIPRPGRHTAHNNPSHGPPGQTERTRLPHSSRSRAVTTNSRWRSPLGAA